jgi:hypothetical protein
MPPGRIGVDESMLRWHLADGCANTAFFCERHDADEDA